MKWQKAKEISVLTTTSRFFGRHPLVLCLLLFLVILYKYFFTWFTFLVSASPVFLFTGFFLGIILAYGEPNIPENDHVYKKIEKVSCQNIHANGKSVGGVSLPRIQSSEERVAEHGSIKRKIRRRSRDHGSSSEPVSSESDDSEADITPMLNAFHQLRSATTSSRSSQDGESNASSTEEDGVENQEDNDADEPGEREDIKVVAWTADDQKNILNIGSLEIERNQRVESLIARRRARKYLETNMIECGGIGSLPSIAELSKFNLQMPTVFAPRKNPFDLPYSEDNFPESAPSVLMPKRNLFDQPCEQSNEGSSNAGASSSHSEPVPSFPPQRNAVFRRYESFTEGAPFFNDFWQDMRPSRLRPYFVTEKMVNEEIIGPNLEGEHSEKSDSKVSSVQDSDSVSSVFDQESQKEILEDSTNKEQEPQFSQTDRQPPSGQKERDVSAALDVEPPVLISDSSDDDVSLPGEHINAWEEANDGENVNLPHDMPLEDHSAIEFPQEMEMTGTDFLQLSPHSNDRVSMSSSSTETSEKLSEMNNIELPSKEVEAVEGTQIADPVYDSSPSGSEKPASFLSAFDETLLQEGNVSGSDAQASMQEENSPSKAEVSSNAVARSVPVLASVEENELRENENSYIRENGNFSNEKAPHVGFDGHVDPVVSESSSQPTTSSSTNAKKAGNIIKSSKKAVLGLFKK